MHIEDYINRNPRITLSHNWAIKTSRTLAQLPIHKVQCQNLETAPFCDQYQISVVSGSRSRTGETRPMSNRFQKMMRSESGFDRAQWKWRSCRMVKRSIKSWHSGLHSLGNEHSAAAKTIGRCNALHVHEGSGLLTWNIASSLWHLIQVYGYITGFITIGFLYRTRTRLMADNNVLSK